MGIFSSLEEKGDIQFEKGNFTKALDFYKKAIEKQSDEDYSLLYKRGNTYFSLRDYNKAIADYSKSISGDSHNTDANFSRGVAYFLVDEIDKAIADMSNCINMTIELKTDKELLASACLMSAGFTLPILNEENIEKVQNLLNISIKSSPNAEKYVLNKKTCHLKDIYADILLDIGDFYIMSGSAEDGIEWFNKAISLDVKNAYVYFNVALLDESASIEDKMKYLGKSILYDKNFAKAYALLGRIYCSIFKWQKGLSNLEKANSIEPTLVNEGGFNVSIKNLIIIAREEVEFKRGYYNVFLEFIKKNSYEIRKGIKDGTISVEAQKYMVNELKLYIEDIAEQRSCSFLTAWKIHLQSCAYQEEAEWVERNRDYFD